MKIIARRLAKLEATRKKQDRERVVYVQPGETSKEALARFFAPYGGETWPVVVMPKPCETIEEWHERYGQPGRLAEDSRRADCDAIT